MEEKQEITATCRDCGKEFIITVSEQNFYESKGLALPKRCAECRAARKAANQQPAEQKEEVHQTKSLDDMLKATGII